jgi:hypothetical protein
MGFDVLKLGIRINSALIFASMSLAESMLDCSGGSAIRDIRWAVTEHATAIVYLRRFLFPPGSMVRMILSIAWNGFKRLRSKMTSTPAP